MNVAQFNLIMYITLKMYMLFIESMDKKHAYNKQSLNNPLQWRVYYNVFKYI